MATNKFTYKTYQTPTLFDGLQNASKEELSYLIALLRQQTMKNIFSDKFNNTVITGKKAFNSVMSFFGKSKKTNDDIDRESKENHQDIKRFAHYKAILKSNSIHYSLKKFAKN